MRTLGRGGLGAVGALAIILAGTGVAAATHCHTVDGAFTASVFAAVSTTLAKALCLINTCTGSVTRSKRGARVGSFGVIPDWS